MMEVEFVCVPEVACEAIVRGDGGRVYCVHNPGGVRHVPPHDLGQFIAEKELGWQTGFWGFIARGVVFPGMTHREGKRAPHVDERSRTAIRGAKDLLAECESLAGVVANIARGNFDRDPDRVAATLRDAWWPPHSRAMHLPIADVRRACEAFREVERGWRRLARGESLRFRWPRLRNPLAPENPLDLAVAAKRGARGGSLRPQRH